MPGYEEPKPQPRRKGPNYHMFAPLIYAPALPLLRLALNGRVAPATRDRIFFSAVLLALGHAGYIMSMDSSV